MWILSNLEIDIDATYPDGSKIKKYKKSFFDGEKLKIPIKSNKKRLATIVEDKPIDLFPDDNPSK